MNFATGTQGMTKSGVIGSYPGDRANHPGNGDSSSESTDVESTTTLLETANPASVIGRRTIRVVIADADFTVRAGVSALLQDSPNLEVVGEARDTQELLRVMKESGPDVVLLDYKLDNAEGSRTIALLFQAQPEVRYVAMGRTMKSRAVRAAFEAGAVGFVARDDDLADLASVIKATGSGETFISRKISQALLEDYTHGTEREDMDPLTDRQKELLALVAQGKSSRAVGQELGITVRTVHTHRSRIMKKLDIHTEAGLVYAAIRMGLVSVD